MTSPIVCACARRVCSVTNSPQLTNTTWASISATLVTTSENTSMTAISLPIMPSTASTLDISLQGSEDDTAPLIGGIVGGFIAVLVVVGIVAVILARNRRTQAKQNGGPPTADAPAKGNYDRVPSSQYGGAVSRSPAHSHYDSLKPSEVSQPA